MSPDWWLKHSLEKVYKIMISVNVSSYNYRFLYQLYQDGIRRMNLTFVLWELGIPAIVTLGLALALPYIVAHSIVPLFGMFLMFFKFISTDN